MVEILIVELVIVAGRTKQLGLDEPGPPLSVEGEVTFLPGGAWIRNERPETGAPELVSAGRT